jgi:hypothetical protein
MSHEKRGYFVKSPEKNRRHSHGRRHGRRHARRRCRRVTNNRQLF